MQEILESVRGRKSRKAGIVTADRYLRSLDGCFEGGFCPTNMLANCSNEHWQELAKASASKLVYTDKDMTVGEHRRDMTANSILDFDAIITSTRKDRDGDVLESAGADVDPFCPLLWQHNPAEPIGKLVTVTNRTKDNIAGRFSIANTQLGRDAATLVEFGALRISHGFDPTEYEPLKGKDAGWHIRKFSVVEVSLVSVPANTDAVITAVSKGKFHSPLIKGWADSVKRKQPKRFKGFDLSELAKQVATVIQAGAVTPDEALALTTTEIKHVCSCATKENEVPDAKPAEVVETKTEQTKASDGQGPQVGDNPDGDPTMGPQVKKVCPKCAYKGKPEEFKDMDPDVDDAAHKPEEPEDADGDNDGDEDDKKSRKSGGRKLSAKNTKRLEHVCGHMAHICGLPEEEMGEHGRPVKSMCKEAMGYCSEMLEESKKEMPQPADEGTDMYQASYGGAKALFMFEVVEHPQDMKEVHDYLGKLLAEQEAREVLALVGGAA